jgi:hypothetical protein
VALIGLRSGSHRTNTLMHAPTNQLIKHRQSGEENTNFGDDTTDHSRAAAATLYSELLKTPTPKSQGFQAPKGTRAPKAAVSQLQAAPGRLRCA